MNTTLNISDSAVATAGGPARLQLISRTFLSTQPHQRRICGLVSPLPHRVAHRLLEYIAENIALSLTIGELAAAVTMSRSHFTRMFILTFGMTPHRFIVKARVEVAQALLEGTSHSLSSIALECGFADQPHFSRVFAKIRGIAPGLWRRTYRISPAIDRLEVIDD